MEEIITLISCIAPIIEKQKQKQKQLQIIIHALLSMRGRITILIKKGSVYLCKFADSLNVVIIQKINSPKIANLGAIHPLEKVA
jgi:hypothetical protein